MGHIIIVPPRIVVTTHTSLLDIFSPAKLFHFVKDYIAHKWDKADIIHLTQTCIAFYNLRYIDGMINALDLPIFPNAEQALVYKIDIKQSWGQNIARFRPINSPDITRLTVHISINPNELDNMIEKLSLLENLSSLSLHFPANMDSDIVENYLAKLFFETPLATLKTLRVESSQLQTLTPFIEKLTTLQTLNLAGCLSLITLPNEIGKLTSLHTINLSECVKLTAIPSELEKRDNLQIIRPKHLLNTKQITTDLEIWTDEQSDTTASTSTRHSITDVESRSLSEYTPTDTYRSISWNDITYDTSSEDALPINLRRSAELPPPR